MNDRPTATELLQAVERFLRDDAVGALEGHLKYQARVAANVVAIVAREIELEDVQLHGEWGRLSRLLGEERDAPRDREELRAALLARNGELVERIRRGEADSGPWRGELVEHLRQTVADKLAVAKPAPQSSGSVSR